MTWLVRPAEDTDAREWERLATTSPDSWLGHSWPWNVDVEEGVWRRPRRSLVLTEGSELLGIAPLHIWSRRFGPLTRKILFSNYWNAGGIAIAAGLAGADRDRAHDTLMLAIHEMARAEGIDKLIVRLPVLSRHNLLLHPEAKNPLVPAGFGDLSMRALVLDLDGRSADAVWRGMAGRARTAIRRAEKLGVEVVRGHGDEAFEAYYPLHIATYRRTGTTPFPDAYFRTVLRSDAFTAFFANLAGKTIAGALISRYGGRAVYSSGASVEEALQVGANNLLQWRAIQWAIDSGLTAYQLGEIPSAGRDAKVAGIVKFKESFGGRLVPAFFGQYVYSRAREHILRLARRMGSPL